MRTKWSTYEEDSCVRTLDRVVVNTKQAHEEEATSGETATDSVLEAQRQREMQELRLMAEAVHGQDVIGLTALTAGFWNHKNAMLRQKHRLEKVLPSREESAELLEGLRRLQLSVEDPRDAGSVSRLIDAVQRANFCDLARFAAEVQHRVCEQSPIVAAYQALGLRSTQASTSLSRQPTLLLSEEGQEQRLADTVRIADSSLQDAEMRANQLHEQLEGLFAGFEQLKLPRAMHSFIPRGIAQGEMKAPPASSVMNAGNTSVPRSIPRDTTTTTIRSNNNNNLSIYSSYPQQQQQQPQPVVNGYTTMHLLRVLCVEAAPHDTAEGLAAQYGVEPHCITDLHQQPLPPLEAFREPTLVLVHIGSPMRGLEESLVSLNRRIELIETTTLPRAKERLTHAREALWSAELEALQAPLRGDGGVTERRRAVENLERDQKRAEEVLEQCRGHKESLLCADFGRLSFMLEAKQLEALEGLGASERLVYTCKEIPKGVSVADFAARMGLPAGEVVTFIDDETGGAMAYVPTLVPRQSQLTLDEQLRREFADFKTAHPSLPPRMDILEQLSALRTGDVATLSQMLSTVRRELERADVGRIKIEADELRVRNGKLDEQLEQAQRIVDSRNDTVQLLRTQNDDLRQAIIAAKERADAAERALQQTKNDVAAMERERESSVQRINALTESLGNAEHRAATLARDLQALRQQHQQELAAARETSDDEMGVLTANRSAMQSQVDTLTTRVNTQRDEIAAYMRKVDALTQQRDEARGNAEQLRTQLAEVNVQVRQTAVLQNDKHAAQSELDRTRAELAELQRTTRASLESMQQQVRLAESKQQQAVAQYKKLEEDAQKAMQSRDMQLATAHEALRKTESSVNGAREAAETETTVLRRQLQNVTSELATARADRWSKAGGASSSAAAAAPDASGSPRRNQQQQQQQSLMQPGLQSPQSGLLDNPPKTGGGGSSPARRVLYVCRPLPRGTSVHSLAAEFGVSTADVVGPFTETHSGDQFCYVPTVAATSSDMIREDERIRSSIVASSANGGLPSVTLLEALHALRSGDIASLAQKVLDGEERVAKAEALLALQARSDALTGSPGTHGMPSLDIADTQALLDDDITHDTAEVLREKILLLKEALANMRARMNEWKELADDYKQQLIAEQAHDITTEQVKADYEHRLDVKMKEINGLEHEVAQLKADLAAAEKRKDEELSVLALARQRLVQDKDNTISNQRRQYEEIRADRDRLLKLLNEHN